VQDSLPAGGLRLYREGVEPSGSLRKVSGYITILLSRTCPVARVVYTKEPFAGPEQVLRYLSRYTHRVAISNRRLVAADANAIAFRWKDYRIDRPDRWKTMTLSPHEFIRRFLMHVLPKGFHRIRHYGLFANGNRAANVARSRELLGAMPRVVEPEEEQAATPDEPRVQPCTCPRCGARMIIIEVFARGCEPRYRPTPAPTSMRIDTS